MLILKSLIIKKAELISFMYEGLSNVVRKHSWKMDSNVWVNYRIIFYAMRQNYRVDRVTADINPRNLVRTLDAESYWLDFLVLRVHL